MATMSELGLEIIDHRVVLIDHDPQNLLVTEAYVSSNRGEDGEAQLEEIRNALMKTINNEEDCIVTVQEWHPGVVEHVDSEGVSGLTDRLMKEAAMKLNEQKLMSIQEEGSVEMDWRSRNQSSDNTLSGYIRDDPTMRTTN